jgi:hypothetical protein
MVTLRMVALNAISRLHPDWGPSSYAADLRKRGRCHGVSAVAATQRRSSNLRSAAHRARRPSAPNISTARGIGIRPRSPIHWRRERSAGKELGTW